MIFKTKDYVSRKDLERHVTGKAGSDPTLNQDHLITGSTEDLKRLNLSTKTTVYGIRCEVEEEIE
jgi:hypothetical protein